MVESGGLHRWGRTFASLSSKNTDATGAALNYKIIVRDGGVIAVLYQEDGAIRPSPFVEHRLPPAGSFVVLPDGSLGKLGALPRGLVVAREPRDLPEHAPMWPCLPGLRRRYRDPKSCLARL